MDELVEIIDEMAEMVFDVSLRLETILDEYKDIIEDEMGEDGEAIVDTLISCINTLRG